MSHPLDIGVATAAPAHAVTFEAAFADLKIAGYRVAYRILGSHEEAEDVAQEAAARAYSRWRKVHDYARPWVCRVAGNLAIDIVRKRNRSAPDREVSSIDPDVGLRIDLQRALATLPRRQREVVVLRYLGDLSVDDVAAALGCAPGTVKRSAHTGLAKLRETLDIDLPDPRDDEEDA